MKRIAVTLFITIITCLFATADDVVKVLRVYSGGEYTTIPLSGIDSLAHSKYDVYGILHDDTISSVIHAIDRKYQIPVDLIDSIVVGECDMQQYEMQIDEVQEFIDEQTGLEINTFQTNLLTWLSSRENVLSTSINGEKSLITVKFKNGLSLYIDFQDASFFSDVENGDSASARMSLYENGGDLFDVSYKYGERIIQKRNILYAKARHLYMFSLTEDYYNNADEERSNIERNIEESPVDLNPLVFSNDISVMGYNWSNYAMVIMSQTHGFKNNKGGFQIKRDDGDDSIVLSNRVLTVYVKDGQIFKDQAGIIIKEATYSITPEVILSKLNNSNTIFMGNYCWSYKLAETKNGGEYTIIGNTTKSGYVNNLKVSDVITKNFFSGILLSDAVKEAPKGAVGTVYFNSLSVSGRGNQRYFSIFMDEIREQSENGNPIIRGGINGYNNLKKNQLDYVVFCHEGPDDFTPDDDDVIKIEIPKDKVNSYGVFNFEIQSDEPLKPATTYRFMFGFEYKGNTYHGETKKFTSSSEPIRAYLEKLYRDTNGDKWTNNTNWCTDAPVEEWYGVSRYYTGLYVINLCDNNLVGSIDLSNCPYIEQLYVGGNDIVDLNLENCSLSNLYVEGWRNITYIQSINVSNCKNLSYLDCGGSGRYVKNLKSVVAKNCHKLQNFDYSEGELETLDLSNCVSIGTVYCYQNKLKELTLTGCIKLYALDCSCNYLTELELSTCTNLRTVFCQENRIKSQIPSYLRLFFENSDYFFVYDKLYDYYVSDFDMSEDGYTQDKNNPVWWYKENEYGWYFPGEPENHGQYTWPE